MTKPTIAIKTYPDKILISPTRKVKDFDSSLKKLSGELIKIMHEAPGIGLAAPQIGRRERIFVCGYQPLEDEDPKNLISLTILVNAKITKYSKALDLGEEGCLSVPGVRLLVPRYQAVSVIGQNLSGERVRIRAKGLFARVIQHEIDHLDGKLIIHRSHTPAKSTGQIKAI